MKNNNRFTKKRPRLELTNIAVITLLYGSYAMAGDYFDPYSLNIKGPDSTKIDLSNFKEKGGQLPGIYQAQVFINDQFVNDGKINFINVNGKLQPSIKKQDLVEWGVSENATAMWMDTANTESISNISKLIPDASVTYDFSQQKVNLSIPQKYVRKDANGYVPMERWDDGINALILDYSYSGSNNWNKYDSRSKNDSFLNLRSGVNINGWRLRNYSTYTKNNYEQAGWNSINTYVQHDVKTLKSKFTAGDASTSGDIFDSFSFRGIQLSSDDSMLPESLRGFAPVIRGTAQSNAQVTITQAGNIIWQNYVPPGPFEIKDLYSTYASGEMVVSVREANGTVRRFVQAFASVPIMLREGRVKYSVSAGKYRATDLVTKRPTFVQGDAIVGLPWSSTLYGGSIISKDYGSVALGLGKGLGVLGSISADGTLAKTKLHDQNKNGASLRFQYLKDIDATGTTFTLASYRYSTSGYYDFSEANGFFGSSMPVGYDSANYNNEVKETIKNQYSNWQASHNKKLRQEINLTQNIPGLGSIYLSSYQQKYWGVKGTETSVGLGYTNSINTINYTFNYNYSKTPFYEKGDQVYSLSLQIPLDKFSPSSWLNLSTSVTGDNKSVSYVGLSGIALADNNLSYNIQQGYGSDGVSYSGNTGVNYKGQYGEYQAGYNYSSGTKQVNYGVMGGVIIHKHGFTLSQPLGDTMTLIKAEGASNVRVMNNAGVYTDKQGYAVVPNTTPYTKNKISLDSSKLPENVDLLTDTKTVIPTSGAIVLAEYPTSTGNKILMKLSNEAVPFGAMAKVNNGGTISQGIVDDRGMVYLSGAPANGTVFITWTGGNCKADYQTSGKKKIDFINAKCQ